MMKSLTAKEIITKYHDEVIDNQKLSKIKTYLSDDIILHTPYLPQAIHGREKFLDFIKSVFSAFSHLKVTTNDVIGEIDRVAVRWTIEGVSTGAFMNIPAAFDNRVICIISLYHLRDGKIDEVWAVDSSMWPKVHDF